MSLQIKEEHLSFLEDKFGKLYHKIAFHVNGDPVVTSSKEDVVQELRIKAIESLNKFKETYSRDIDEFISTSDFAKYLKTSLWNYKNFLGSNITLKQNIISPISLSSSANENGDFDFEGSSVDTSEYLKDLKDSLCEDELVILNILSSDPKASTSSGRPIIEYIWRSTPFSLNQTKELTSRVIEKALSLA